MSELAQRVRRRMVATSADLATAVRAEAGGIVDEAVLAGLRREVSHELIGVGPLESVLCLAGVTDVLVNGPQSVWFDRGFGMERAAITFTDEAAVRALAQRLVASAGQRLDDALPYADAVLLDGTRLHAVLPPLCASTTLSLRVLNRHRLDLSRMVAGGAMPEPVAELLRAVLAARISFVITGGTGTGKTTLLAALLGLVGPRERILLIEDAPELRVEHPHTVRLVTRGANVEGAGVIGLRELVRQALRMRPDRLVVGEFRGTEMVELLVALNTGHDGGAATLHANSAADVPARLTALGALAGLSPATVASLASSALRCVVHLRRDVGAALGSDEGLEVDGELGKGLDVASGPRATRVVEEIGLMAPAAGGGLEVLPVWSRARGVGIAAGELARELHARGAAAELIDASQ
jgi:pilus assembly protein CpaF